MENFFEQFFCLVDGDDERSSLFEVKVMRRYSFTYSQLVLGKLIEVF